jgi:hypothetical protein
MPDAAPAPEAAPPPGPPSDVADAKTPASPPSKPGEEAGVPAVAVHQPAADGPSVPPAAATAGAATAASRAAAAAAAAAASAATGPHSAGGVAPPTRPPCAFFLKTGTCAFGDRCRYSHPYDRVQPIAFNSLGLPLRPGERIRGEKIGGQRGRGWRV